MGMSVGDCLVVIDVGGLSSLWAASFPRQVAPERPQDFLVLGLLSLKARIKL